MKDRNDKNLLLKGEGWRIKAMALDVPSRDVAISFKLNNTMRNSEVAAEVKRINKTIKEWFDSSSLMHPGHFIKVIKSPSYPHDREMRMVFLVELSVYSRKEIQLGKTEGCFEDVFMGELKRLRDCFELS